MRIALLTLAPALLLVACGDVCDVDRGAATCVGEPLEQPVDFAFKAGLWWEEQMWLRGETGGLVRVDRWPASVGERWMMAGPSYGIPGRFSPPRFDHSGRHLLFAEKVAQHPEPERWRMVVHDIRSGWSELTAGVSERVPAYAVGYDVTLALTWLDGMVELHELVDRRFEVVARAEAGDPQRARSHGYLRQHGGAPVLMLPNGVGWRRAAGEWSPWGSAESTERGAYSPSSSPGGMDMCFSHVPPEGGTPEAHLLQAQKSSALALPEDTRPVACGWAPDGARLYVNATADEEVVFLFDAEGRPEGSIPGLSLVGSWRGKGVGWLRGELVFLDWLTLETTALLAPADSALIASQCGELIGSEVSPWLVLPPDSHGVALLWAMCETLDSNHSGVLLVDLESAQVTIAQRAREQWLFSYSVSGAGDVLYATQTGPLHLLEPERCPETVLWRFDPDGARRELDPLSDPCAILHSPVFPGSETLPSRRVQPLWGVW